MSLEKDDTWPARTVMICNMSICDSLGIIHILYVNDASLTCVSFAFIRFYLYTLVLRVIGLSLSIPWSSGMCTI